MYYEAQLHSIVVKENYDRRGGLLAIPPPIRIAWLCIYYSRGGVSYTKERDVFRKKQKGYS